MPTPRYAIVSNEFVGIYHCLSRCVRRAFLCGFDPLTGKSFNHRRRYINKRIKDLAIHFCLKIISSNVQSNHLHIIIKADPSASAHLHPQDVVRRWRRIFPLQRDHNGNPLELSDDELLREMANTDRVNLWRSQLVDLSWFMRCVKEPIARMANKEDGCKGHFWEGRFKCLRIEDDAALLACMAYVELNPIRAGEVDRPEYCDFSSIKDRIIAYKARRKQQLAKDYVKAMDSDVEGRRMMQWALRESKQDQWLCPLEEIFEGWNGYSGGISEEHFLELVDWTGRKMRDQDAGHIPAHLAQILERMEVDLDNWVRAVEGYGGLFHVIAGKARRLRELAEALGKRCFWGVNLKIPLYRVGKA